MLLARQEIEVRELGGESVHESADIWATIAKLLDIHKCGSSQRGSQQLGLDMEMMQ